MQWSLAFSRVNHSQSTTSLHFSIHSSRVAMANESTKSPLHLNAPWHSLAGHLEQKESIIVLEPTTKAWILCAAPTYLLLFSTDAIRTGLNHGWIYTPFSAVCKEDAEFKGWLPWPPVALLILATKLVTSLRILGHFEVQRILLKLKWMLSMWWFWAN